MLNSLLKRSSKKIKVDRVMKVYKEEKVLLTEDNEVLSEVRSHFIKQFRKRNINQDHIPKRWIEAYSPIEKINKEIYANLGDKLTEKEWKDALSKAKNKSAPGISGISYPLIKKARKIAQKIFRLLADQCIVEGDISVK